MFHAVLSAPLRLNNRNPDTFKVEKARKSILKNESKLGIKIPQASFSFGNLLNDNIFLDGAFTLQNLKTGGSSKILEQIKNIYAPAVSFTNDPYYSEEKMYQNLIKRFILHVETKIRENPLSLETDEHLNVALEALKYFLKDDAIKGLQKLVLKEKIQRISAGNNIIFPVHLGYGKDELVLNNTLGVGRYGIAYDAHLKNSITKEPLVVKVYHGKEDIMNVRREKNMLAKLGRLVKYYDEFWMLVYKQVQGKNLLDVIMDNDSQEMYKDDYKKLSRNFYRDTGWIHGDIRPPNVIVNDKTGTLNLIDFGRSFKPNSKEVSEALTSDEEYALEEYNHCVLFSKMTEGYKTPNDDSSFEKIEGFIDSLIRNKDGRQEEIAPAVRKYFRHLCKLQMKDRFKYHSYKDA